MSRHRASCMLAQTHGARLGAFAKHRSLESGSRMNSTPPSPMAGRIERTGNPLVLAVLALAFGSAVLALWFNPNGVGMAIVTTMIVALAFFGALGLLLFSFGLVQFPTRAARFDT